MTQDNPPSPMCQKAMKWAQARTGLSYHHSLNLLDEMVAIIEMGSG
jgi:hypothetical protein